MNWRGTRAKSCAPIPQGSIRHENPILASIQPHLGQGRVVAAQCLISDREAWQAGIHKVQGYDPVPLARFGLYAAATAPRQNAALAFAGFHGLNLPTAQAPVGPARRPLRRPGRPPAARPAGLEAMADRTPAGGIHAAGKPDAVPPVYHLRERRRPAPRVCARRTSNPGTVAGRHCIARQTGSPANRLGGTRRAAPGTATSVSARTDRRVLACQRHGRAPCWKHRATWS